MIKQTEHMMHDVHHVMAQLKRGLMWERLESVRSRGKPGEEKRTGLKLKRRKESSKGAIPP